MNKEMTYWVALSRAGLLSEEEKNRIIVELYNQRIPLSEFFEEDVVGWSRFQSVGGLSADKLSALRMAKEELPNSAFLAEDLMSQRYWLLELTSAGYPLKIKRKLKYKSPVLLYGRGDRRLLQSNMAMIMPGNEYDNENDAFAKKAGEDIARRGLVLLGGQEKGGDEAAIEGALGAGGKVVMVISEGIMKFGSNYVRWYPYLTTGRFTVVSCCPPDEYSNVDNQRISLDVRMALADEIIGGWI